MENNQITTSNSVKNIAEEQLNNLDNPSRGMIIDDNINNDVQQFDTTKMNRELDFMNEYIHFAIKKNEHLKMVAQLTPTVCNKIRSLRKLQLQTINLDAEFHRMVYDLERKYQEKHKEIFNKRCDIINGKYQPTEDECDFPDLELPTLSRVIEQLNIEPSINSNLNENIDMTNPMNGVPNFWLTILKYVPMFDSMVKEADEPVLKYLSDIRVTSSPLPDLSFRLEFVFEPNEYFENQVLTKEYLMKCSPDADDPFSFDGPEIYKSIGCEIHWKEGKDLSEKLIKKKTSDAKGKVRTEKNETFFDFFTPPEIPENDNDSNFEDINNLLELDFEVGHYFKERIVPKAILYFTGEQDDDAGDSDNSDDGGSSSSSVRGSVDDNNDLTGSRGDIDNIV